MVTGISAMAGWPRIGTTRVCCPATRAKTCPRTRAGTATTPTGAASPLVVRATTGLTDAIAQVLPRVEVAVIVVAPVVRPVTGTTTSV